MTRAPQRRYSLVEALVALAARDGLGEPVDWADVRAALLALERDPVGASDLRRIVARVNDPAVPRTLRDWFLRAADEREGDADEAARAGEKLLAPLQLVSLGGVATGAIAAAAGTVGAALAIPVIGAAAVVAGAATYGRWRLSRREDTARRDARALRRMAGSARIDSG